MNTIKKKPLSITWHLHTISAFMASISTTLPFPSSPHWAPKTTVTLELYKFFLFAYKNAELEPPFSKVSVVDIFVF